MPVGLLAHPELVLVAMAERLFLVQLQQLVVVVVGII
jgi:hypothetical protein